MRLPALCLALLLTTTAAATPPARSLLSPTRSRGLETELLRAVREVGFDQVRDWRHKGERIAHMPNVDVAVIELDAEGRPVAAANVLLSRDYPKGRAVPVDAKTLGTTAVRFTRWDLEAWGPVTPVRTEALLLPGTATHHCHGAGARTFREGHTLASVPAALHDPEWLVR